MMLRLKFSALPLVLTLTAAGFLTQPASAGYETENANDPFVQMRTNTGEQMMAQLPDRRIYIDSYVPAFGAPVLFVAPLPPVLGDDPPEAPLADYRNSPAADCAHEVFFGGYSILAGRSKLSATETARIGAYRRSRQQLFGELKAKFDELAGTTAGARAAAFAELATQQAVRLRQLEADAETIRNDLAWINSSIDSDIEIRTGASHFGRPAEEQSELFNGAYFYAGLSTAQRLLLLEVAYEQTADSGNNPPEPAPGFFFLPATARLRLPTDLPPALEAKIHTFTREKESLKDELRSAVLQPYFLFTSTRTRRLTELAQKQAPALASLEALAEEIRVGLAGLGFPGKSADLALPAELTQRVGRFYAGKVKARRELLNRLWSLRNEFIDAKFEIVRSDDGLGIAQSGGPGAPAGLLADFNAGLARQYTAFAAESETLRRDIQHYLASDPQRPARTVDQIAADFAKAYAARENLERSRDYRRAVLEPGLSPAQRRLMFSCALAELEQTSEPLQP